jgi:ABC-type multidrug transport system ATPase subunit
VILTNENIAFIYQEDSFFSQLSVRETLYLAASLRLYNNASQDTVSEIIHYLALDHVADGMVGDIVNRGISGGEKKRFVGITIYVT